MKKFIILFLPLIFSCGEPTPPGNHNNTGNIEIDPIDATGIVIVQVSNQTLNGNIIVQGEPGRSLIEVIPDLSALTPEELAKITITSEIFPGKPDAVSIFANGDDAELSFDILVLVPSEIFELLVNAGDFGDVSISDMDGLVDSSAGLGNITVDNIQGPLVLELEEGDIFGTNIFSPEIDIITEVGIIDLECFPPAVADIRIDAALGPGGPVTLRVPVDTGATLFANTGGDNGVVTIDPALLFDGVINNFQADGTIVGGGTRDIRILNGEGSIDVIGF